MQPRLRSDSVAPPLSEPTVNDFTSSELEELSAVTVYVPATVMHTSADVEGTEPVLHFAASLQSPLTGAFHESVHPPAARAVPAPATAIARVATAVINATVKMVLSAELGARLASKSMSSVS
ncbi:MAG TPA: hypothetical protein VNV42_13975 [Solirubrobacteraceae bacterium]|nr:hypothetical protein [Solirubrobacteraceae bacterium]